jgi:NADH:ubiquinone oxidoreductase subunit F (NADH-binding)
VEARLLAGRPLDAGPESLSEHLARLGPLPVRRSDLISEVSASGLLGRGGGAFPVGRKWATVADYADGDGRLLVNGAEGEPLSAKDRTLMALRPHLVLDGALLAAHAVGAREVVVYVGEGHRAARNALTAALRERHFSSVRPRVPVRLVAAPDAYVAGEESAAVHYVNAGDARPTSVPPRPYERGIDGRPTLVQNVETLAHVALIARLGEAWYRSAGRTRTPGTALVTVHGVRRPGVREIEYGTGLADIANLTGVDQSSVGAVLVGGYFGSFVAPDRALGLALDPIELRASGVALGAGVVAFIERSECGVAATAGILEYMASQSAAQCGPCVFGLRAIADTVVAVAQRRATAADFERLARWQSQLMGRGACHHPDGVANLLASAFAAFDTDFATHVNDRRCVTARMAASPGLRVAA